MVQMIFQIHGFSARFGMVIVSLHTLFLYGHLVGLTTLNLGDALVIRFVASIPLIQASLRLDIVI